MSVLSLTWILWMAVTVAVFWLTPSRYRHYVLIGLTSLFLAYNDPGSMALLLVMAGVSLLVCRRDTPGAGLVTFAIVLIIVLLVYFKLGYGFEGRNVDAALRHALDDRDRQVRQAAEDLLG